MIARVSGTLIEKDFERVVVDVNGVGYELLVPLRTLEALDPVGGQAVLHVHTAVSQDDIRLFGFGSVGDRRLFRRMISVSGIGPKLAISALSVYDAAELQGAIMRGDVKKLARVPGIGARTAQRMVLELAGTIGAIDVGGAPPSPAQASDSALGDVRAGLLALGYADKQIDRVADALSEKARAGVSLETLLKDALALLRSL
jgi:Holliday junction DNA helicase RuvA